MHRGVCTGAVLAGTGFCWSDGVGAWRYNSASPAALGGHWLAPFWAKWAALGLPGAGVAPGDGAGKQAPPVPGTQFTRGLAAS